MALIHGNDKRQTTEQNKQSKSNGYYGRHKSTGLFPVENSIRDLSLHWIDTVHITATSGTYLSQQVHHHIVSYPGRPIQHLQQQTYHILPVGLVCNKWRIRPRPLQALFL
jgi:hypothetical protein